MRSSVFSGLVRGVSENTRQFVYFIAFAVLWSALAGLLMKTALDPLAIFMVWIVGFVWGVGYIASGKRSADILLKTWLGTIGAAILAGSIIFLLLWPVS
ncbi:MAG: hypothetical protein EOR57_31595 [Mesorhizobium sp.]|uniref:hypothetical protein n=1 Tax=Mesorhizobium sp. TaxID=1871066 RepID=UPI000FE65532|nr:hypothetical protein [Mesorhizobium sp.]RWL14892.1 MAG: hypothetical protein EOR57_31595 [Mesorhizobium sp.]